MVKVTPHMMVIVEEVVGFIIEGAGSLFKCSVELNICSFAVMVYFNRIDDYDILIICD